MSSVTSNSSVSSVFDSSLLRRHWTFEPSEIEGWRKREVVRTLLRRAVRRPHSVLIKAPTPSARWALYFIYAPDGQLSLAHRYTLARLKDEGFAILAICAGADRENLPRTVAAYADAVCWKATGGYDFSAYTLGLEILAKHSYGATVLVLNDSVLGPFRSLRDHVDRAEWDFTGFTACGLIENHVQSYAFVISELTPSKVRRMWTVLFPYFALNGRDDVIFCQETRLARVASQQMSTGALWYYPSGDMTQIAPLELLDQNFPFVKRSLLTNRSSFMGRQSVIERLAHLGHPLE